MTTGLPALRALVIYGLCLPLALMVGYLLANPIDWSTIAFFGIVVFILCAPMLLKWHYPLLVVTLNMTAIAFFIPGRPDFWMVFVAISLAVSVLQMTLSRRMLFLHTASITGPMLFLAAVVLVTMKLTGGIGFFAFGGDQVGGRRYFNELGAILVYFALTTYKIPLHKAKFYSGLFFLGGATVMVGTLIHFVSPSFYFIFWIFPPEAMPGEGVVTESGELVRMSGLGAGSVAVIAFLLSRYGFKGLFASGSLWRPMALLAFFILSFFGGFRSILILIMLLLFFQGLLEGAFKSRWMPVLALSGILVLAVGIPFVSKLPLPFQRALSVLPLDVSQEARDGAQATSEWRLQLWREVLPEVPRYLFLGKGYSMNTQDWAQANSSASFKDASFIVAGDYHNGPLSVLIPLGIWGAIGFLWLLWAGGRLLYFNFRYGDPTLKNVNTFLLAAFVAQIVLFLFVFGSLYSDLIKYTSLLGFSVALNGGKCRPAPAPAPEPVRFKLRAPLKPTPGFSR